MPEEIVQVETLDATVSEPRYMPVQTPMDLVALALREKADPGFLERLLAIQQQVRAEEQRMLFVEAVAAFKATSESVLPKESAVRFGQTNYNYASLGAEVAAISKPMSAVGLVPSWEVEQTEDLKAVKVTCHVTHSGGHRESVSISSPLDTSGNKNPVQEVGSTVTYLRRYTLECALGLATAEEDNDGRGAQPTHGKATTPVPKPQTKDEPRPGWPSIFALWDEHGVAEDERKARAKAASKDLGIQWDKEKKRYAWTEGALAEFLRREKARYAEPAPAPDPLADDGPIDYDANLTALWDAYKIDADERKYLYNQHSTAAGVDSKALWEAQELRFRTVDDAHNADETPTADLFKEE
jgi:hypothetical protein